MCLVVFALDAHPQHRLVLAGNRDEAFARPAAPVAPWPDAPGVVAGRDLEAGGTWLGVADGGRWAVLTNVRDPQHPRLARRSRGALAAEFLRGTASADDYADAVIRERDLYDGFNLVVGDRRSARVVSTRPGGSAALGPGVYGLSNDRLDTPWPKTVRARDALAGVLAAPGAVDPSALLALLDDRRQAPDAALPDTGVGLALERVLSPVRIVAGDYGTRVSTALVLDRDGGGTVSERTWRPDGTAAGTRSVALDGGRPSGRRR